MKDGFCFLEPLSSSNMENVLLALIGKKLDVVCMGAVAQRGENNGVSGGVLKLTDDEGKVVYIAIGAIVAVNEVSDATSRPGFIG